MDEFTEDNAELLALQSAESVRMGHILQAVPKMEGAITLLKEHSEHMGSCGMELGRLPREVADDRELTEPFEILSNGMLRASRRSKRLALEIGAAVNPFTMQYKLCRYEKMAFQDRRNAIVRRHKERGKADQRAAQLMYQQRGMYGGAQPYGGQGPYGAQPNPYGPGGLDRMERDAVIMDEMATDAVRECEEIGVRLKSEVNRIAYTRQIEWLASVRVIAEAMKEASTERLAIWKSTQEQYLQAFPEFKQGTNE